MKTQQKATKESKSRKQKVEHLQSSWAFSPPPLPPRYSQLSKLLRHNCIKSLQLCHILEWPHSDMNSHIKCKKQNINFSRKWTKLYFCFSIHEL